MMHSAWLVFCKELRDALRDRRTLAMVLLSSVAIGPLLLVALSALVADIEAQAESRVVYAVGLGQAPTLHNFILRQTWDTQAAPADYEAAMLRRSFGHAVLVVPATFEQDLADGVQPTLQLVSASANNRAQGRPPAWPACCAALTRSKPRCAWRCAVWRPACCRRWT